MEAVISVVFTLLLLLYPVEGNTQNTRLSGSNKRVKENFDFNWQFHKGDIAMKSHGKSRVVREGITDINVNSYIR